MNDFQRATIEGALEAYKANIENDIKHADSLLDADEKEEELEFLNSCLPVLDELIEAVQCDDLLIVCMKFDGMSYDQISNTRELRRDCLTTEIRSTMGESVSIKVL